MVSLCEHDVNHCRRRVRVYVCHSLSEGETLTCVQEDKHNSDINATLFKLTVETLLELVEMSGILADAGRKRRKRRQFAYN